MGMSRKIRIGELGARKEEKMNIRWSGFPVVLDDSLEVNEVKFVHLEGGKKFYISATVQASDILGYQIRKDEKMNKHKIVPRCPGCGEMLKQKQTGPSSWESITRHKFWCHFAEGDILVLIKKVARKFPVFRDALLLAREIEGKNWSGNDSYHCRYCYHVAWPIEGEAGPRVKHKHTCPYIRAKFIMERLRELGQ